MKAFRTNLDIFIRNLVMTLSLTPLLFEEPETTSHSTPIISLLLAWLNSMSSSPLRPIRHTGTYITLKIVTELCDVASTVSKDLSLKQRQKETEAKKSGAGPAFQKRMKDAETKVKEAHTRKTKIEGIMQDTFSA
jgi:cohesin complex subunit SA-1/2